MRPSTLVPLACSTLLSASVIAAPADLATLAAGDRHHGFEATTVWLDANDRPLGARFRHPRTGFQLDVLQIESVPQAFTWVKTFATGDQGEPHTQEHLLLLRGIRGRTLQTKKSMSLVTSTAYTETWRTSYMFNTSAGVDAFFDIFAEQQRAMLHPDYSDAEIRLEVRNFGVTKNADGTLRLEEKGTVYNEMVASMANGAWKAWRAQKQVVYGDRHPLAYNVGGEPAGIRTMTPADIRKFHKATHHLANMGTVAAFPKSVPLDTQLKRFNEVLMRDAPKGAPRPADSLDKLPAPAGDPTGSVRIYDYPHANAAQPSPLTIVWRASKLDATEQLLAELFFGNIAGDATTNLYKLFIDGRTRKLDIGARSVSAAVAEDATDMISISFTDVRPAEMSDEGVRRIRSLVTGEIARIAAFADGSPELREFNERIESRLVERERQAAKFLGTPPNFGARNGNSMWVDLLLMLESSPGTRKSLVMKPQLAHARKLLASGTNFWREHLAKWMVAGVTPYVAGARPSPALIAREEAEREARLEEETARIKARYKVDDTQEALRRFAAEADAEYARIERATKVAPTAFLKSPPMTLDDHIQYESVRLANGVPLVASRFDNMTGALAGIALRLDGLTRDDLRYVSLLPQLLATVGVIEEGRPVSYEQMSERLRREILALTQGFSSNSLSGRVELVLRGSGIGVQESQRALDWMALVLHSPDWRPENLPRIRDVVDQALARLRNTMQGSEESWTRDPATAYRMQRHPAYLAAESFLTRTHNALRLRWLLKDPAPGDGEALAAFLAGIGEMGRGMNRDQLKAMLTGGKAPGLEWLSPTQRAIADEALRDLDLSLIEMPDTSLGADFAYLANAIRADLATPATESLAQMESLRRRLLRTGGARMFLASSAEVRQALAPRIEAFAAKLASADLVPIWHGSEALVDARLRMRDRDAAPAHVGLHAPNKQGGVIATSAPIASYADTGDRDKLLDFLATRLYSGGASHTLFAKQTGAGLSYGGGTGGSPSDGRAAYYAERTPELPQTVRFASATVKESPLDRALGEYVLAQTFLPSRASATYESRAEGIANDLADGNPPDQVRAFRQAILELRQDPKLVDQVFARKDRVHARLIPGYGTRPLTAADGTYFVIGPDKQLDAWERYLQATEGKDARLHRLYGRDFWMP